MPYLARSLTAWLVLTAAPAFVCAQLETDNPVQLPLAPERPQNAQELNHCEALKLYCSGLLQQHANRLVEALHSLEAADHLDPEASAVQRALIPVYMSLDRGDDALATCTRILDRDPADADTWYIYARQLKAQDRLAEARTALERAVRYAHFDDRPELRLQMNYELGNLHENFKDYTKAAAAFRVAVAILDKPDDLLDEGFIEREDVGVQAAEVYERLGRVCVQAGNFEEAVAAFQNAQRKDPSRTHRLAYNLAEVYATQQDWSRALASITLYLQSQPQGTEAYEREITYLDHLGRRDDVVPALEQHVAADPNNVGLKLLLGRELARNGQAAQAAGLYQALARQQPTADIYRSWFALDKQQGERGLENILQRFDTALTRAARCDHAPETAEAGAHAQAMLTVLREDKDLLKSLLPLALQRLPSHSLGRRTRLFFAATAARAHQLPQAELLYRSCLAEVVEEVRHEQDTARKLPSNPNDPAALEAVESRKRDEPDIYGGLLRVLWQAQKHEAILDVCGQGLKDGCSANRVLLQVDLARALVLLGRTEEALYWADAAIEAAKDDEKLFACRAHVLVLTEAERYDQAVATCKALLQTYTLPADVRDIRYALSAVYSSARDYVHAEEQLRLILDADPSDASACNDLGYILADQNKNLDEAEKLIRQALELDRQQKTSDPTAVGQEPEPDNAAYVDSLGWVLFRQGKLAEARAKLEEASSALGGDDPVVWDHLAEVYLQQGERAKAAAAWHKAVELYEGPQHCRPADRYREVQRKLQQLETAPEPR